jgi:hypothetical protein
MAKPVKSGRLGRNLLIGVALGTVPIVGCAPRSAPLDAPTGAITTVQPEERALFDQASQSGNIALIDRFLRTYPESPLVRRLLVNLPPETLGQIDRTSLVRLNAPTIRSLPPDIRLALGLAIPATKGGSGASSDGYAG